VAKVLATIALGAIGLAIVAQPAAAQSPTDRDIAKAGVFQADDFPAGWRTTPHKKSESIDTCPALKKKAEPLRKQRAASVSSDDFEHGSVEEFTSTVAVMHTANAAERSFDLFQSRRLRRCISDAFDDAVKKQAKEQDFDLRIDVGSRTGARNYGDESSSISFKMTVSMGISLDLYGDIIFVRVGRALGYYTHLSNDEDSTCSEFDEDCVEFDALITSATDRLTTATGGQPSGTGRT
jgi:hypothetical protein